MRSTPFSATTANRVWSRDTPPPYVAAPTANGTFPELRAQAVSTRAFSFFNWQAAHQVTVAHPAPSAVTYHKSLILRRRNNQNADQQNWRFNHHVHRHFRSHQEPGERQEQMYNMDVMEPFQDAEQELQREKRHQKVQKSREQEETHWLAFRFGNHLQRQGRSAGPEAWRDRKTSTNGSQTRGQFHQHSNPSGPGPEHEWGFTFSRSSPILSSLNVLSRNKRRCFTVIDFPAQRAGFNSKGSSCCFPPMVLIFIHGDVIFAKQLSVITGDTTWHSWLLV